MKTTNDILFMKAEIFDVPMRHAQVSFTSYKDGKIGASRSFKFNLDFENVEKEYENKEIINQMNQFIVKYFGSERPLPGGYDVYKTKELLMNYYRAYGLNFEKYVYHRTVNLSGIVRTLQTIGILEMDNMVCENLNTSKEVLPIVTGSELTSTHFVESHYDAKLYKTILELFSEKRVLNTFKNEDVMYLFADVESGGLDAKESSLLEFSLVALDSHLNVVDTLNRKVKYEMYHVSPRALEVNQINLIDLYREGKTPKELDAEILEFFKKNFKSKRALLSGHNVFFDLNFLLSLQEDVHIHFANFTESTLIDTMSLLALMFELQLVPFKSGGTDAAFKHFGIEVSHRHTAFGDCMATVELYQHICKTLIGKIS